MAITPKAELFDGLYANFGYCPTSRLYLRRKPAKSKDIEMTLLLSQIVLLQRSQEVTETSDRIKLMLRDILREQDSHTRSLSGLHRKVDLIDRSAVTELSRDLLTISNRLTLTRSYQVSTLSRIGYLEDRVADIKAILTQRQPQAVFDPSAKQLNRIEVKLDKLNQLLDTPKVAKRVGPRFPILNPIRNALLMFNPYRLFHWLMLLLLVLSFLLMGLTVQPYVQPVMRVLGQVSMIPVRIMENAELVEFAPGDNVNDFVRKCFGNLPGCVKVFGQPAVAETIVSTAPDFKFIERNTFSDDGEFAPIVTDRPIYYAIQPQWIGSLTNNNHLRGMSLWYRGSGIFESVNTDAYYFVRHIDNVTVSSCDGSIGLVEGSVYFVSDILYVWDPAAKNFFVSALSVQQGCKA